MLESLDVAVENKGLLYIAFHFVRQAWNETNYHCNLKALKILN